MNEVSESIARRLVTTKKIKGRFGIRAKLTRTFTKQPKTGETCETYFFKKIPVFAISSRDNVIRFFVNVKELQ